MNSDNGKTPQAPTGEPVAMPAPPGGMPVSPAQPGCMPVLAGQPSGTPQGGAQQVLPVQPNDALPPPVGAPVPSGAVPTAAQAALPTNAPTGAPVGSMSDRGASQRAQGAGQAVGTDVLPAPEGQPVIYHDKSLNNGIVKCPSCGASDIQLNVSTGLLHCNFCHREFSEVADGIDGDISRLTGMHMGVGTSDIVFDASDAVTLKCTGCGAEVVVDTNEAPQARCHWCRHVLSLNQQVPNGAIPDAIMPFRITREQAQAHIEQFVGKRKFFAHPRFKAEFTTENVMGVYFPYMVVDVNTHAVFQGEGEHETRRYTTGSGSNKTTKYDADVYGVGRDFDLYIDDLTIEASSERLDQATAINSNNIINAILPYPLKETVRFNANYLRGFTSEKRNVNRDQISSLVTTQVRDIARWQAWQQATFYDRGIRWDVEDVAIKGELWKAVYLPVWLYSYLETKSNGKKFLHYVAVNACTGETMGSVPIHKPKLLAVSAIVEVFGIILGVALAIILFLGS